MNILITGGAGMVGSHCAEYFSKDKNNKIIVYDNLMRSQIFSSDGKSVEYNWHYLEKFKNIILIKKDIREIEALDKCFKEYKPDVVIHAAAQPGVRFGLDNPHEDFTINCSGTVNVIEALRKHNPKGTFIYCSTNKVYGDNVNEVAIVEKEKRYEFENLKGISESESIDMTGHTPYGVSKLAGDLYVQDFAHTYGLKTAVYRMSCMYGTRQFGFEDQGWLAWFSIRFVQGEPITIYGDGKQIRDVLWVGDLVSAFDKFIKSDLKHEVFNIGGGHENTLSLLELVEILENILKKKIKVGFGDWRKFDQKVYVSDISKVKKVLNWAPSVSPEEGIKRIVEWVKENPGLF
jgi:CDP-paratose 2-epimerase